MTYTVSSGTLNTTIPYHTIGRGPIRGNAVRSRTWELWAHLVPFPRRVTILVENRKFFTFHDVYLTPSCDGVSDGVPQREFIWKESNDGSVTCWKSLMTSSTVLTQYQSVTKIRNCFYVLFFLFRIFVFGSRGLSWHYRPRFRAHVIIIIIIIIPTNVSISLVNVLTYDKMKNCHGIGIYETADLLVSHLRAVRSPNKQVVAFILVSTWQLQKYSGLS